MIVNVQNQQQIKIKADLYEAVLTDKSQQQLKQVFSRYTQAQYISLDLDNISQYNYDNSYINQMLKDLLFKLNKFDVIIDIRIKNILSLHYDGTLISHSYKLNQKQVLSRNNNIINNVQHYLNAEDKINNLENRIIYIDYIVYQRFEVNVSFRILNDDYSSNQDSKQVIDNLCYYLNHMIDFSLTNVLSIENILLTQMKIKIYEQQFKIDCSYNKVKFHALIQDENSSFSYCIIRLIKMFSANQIDLYVDDETMHELLEHLFHEENKEKAKSINQLKIKAFSKEDPQKFINLVQEGNSIKIEYNSDKMKIQNYILENLFTVFNENAIQFIFLDVKSVHFLKEVRKILKYANIHQQSQLDIKTKYDDFFIKREQINKQKVLFDHNLHIDTQDLILRQPTKNIYQLCQFNSQSSECDTISANKQLIKILCSLNVQVFRYLFDTQNRAFPINICLQEKEKKQILSMIDSKCFSNVLDIRTNLRIINNKLINKPKHALLAYLTCLKRQNQLNILRKEIIQEAFIKFYFKEQDE
ncbi:hypothetical protein TTHERM_00820650 (macronuclear) [Tetrahymena thermophila SB210]|uniref:Uncharacterized protein n=1 Tax=Tetrahymena thermophila (strain SB210) TaxID=312017 RepID=Q23H80_TETTS|nr:hypothetical protein TTHERM_00820650 [Tetrahymena thermophila SB210]EAR95928.2 hypothetical protein TTHERM_00820650 [Tetrahymena thermophila SB210]|eukprot:XP_001016173.2 hypothetical protein TTHERM_00820650 [Tetrahymena thermophila SB210]